jgi:predicted aconitase
VPLTLTYAQRVMADGGDGAGAARAMSLVTAYAEAVGAARLIEITGAHIDGCLHHGQVSLDFVRQFVDVDARVRVPTTLNVGSLDLIHPGRVRSGPQTADGRALMEAHVALGCAASFTCAPYQLAAHRPKTGTDVAWGESNAIAFANSVLGARTERYGDFIDLACALTGYAPAYGLHLPENRRARLHVTVDAGTLEPGVAAVATGLALGRAAGSRVAAISGLSVDISEDDLKALGAAAASTGAVGLFHVIGRTPEAMTFQDAFPDGAPEAAIHFSQVQLRAELAALSQVPDAARLSAVSLGTPHFSLSEFARLMPLLDGGRAAIPFTINTARAFLPEIERRGWKAVLDAFGVSLVADTCVYLAPVLDDLSGAVMTNSGKMALYAPANIGCVIAFGSLAECVASARAGRVVRL